MAEIIYQIPSFEKDRVQRIMATDVESECFIAAQMVDILRTKWNTSVLCISLDGHKDAIESLIPKEKAVGTIHVLDQKNPTYDVIYRKATGFINRRFVRALIISGVERLTTRFNKDRTDKGREWVTNNLERLFGGIGVPVILLEVHQEQSEGQ